MTQSRPLNILITGGARGIGRGLTRFFLSKGNRVFILDRNADELAWITKILSNFSNDSSFSHTQCDLRSPDQIRSAIQLAAEFFSNHLDLLVNNAVLTPTVGTTPFAELTLDEWNAHMDINLTAPFLVTQACIPLLASARGSIVNISSMRARQSVPDSEGYAASKAGLLGLTHAVSMSLADKGIRANAILPGWIDVGHENREGDEEGRHWGDRMPKAVHEWHPVGRVGKVEDVCGAVEFLARSPFVTGAELVLDGGSTRKMVYPV